MAATSKRKRLGLSKNRKKTWIKHINVKDVEEFLEEKRLDDRLGGPLEDKPDNALFSVDKTPASPRLKASKVLTKRERRSKKLTCFQNLEPTSKVPPPIIPCRVRDPEERKPAAVRKKQQKRSARRCQQAAVDRQISANRKEKEAVNTFKLPDFYDVWESNEKEQTGLDEDSEKFINEYTKKRRPNIPLRRYQKPSLLPPVEVPHPGASYNPAYDDHQALLSEALTVEEKKLREEKHIERVLTNMLPTREEAPTEATKLAEMSQGLFEHTDDSDSECDVEPPHMNPPVRAEDRKTKQKRRRELEQQRIRWEAKKRKEERIAMNEVFKVKNIETEYKQMEAKAKQTQLRNEERLAEKMYKPHKMSRFKFEEPDKELKLSEELAESLRKLKPEGSVLEDRYKSLQKRNIIETRKRHKVVVKYKPKRLLKREHRLFLENETKKWNQ
ncbi:ribosome biogenesis protein NOP53-like [Ornithodoros turicata]|uniref:ribosome biogenesis protein NOP53-like n=1 Tax=Ornithodoros turicata TaxID=34597 RepID=UPI0031388C54